MLEHNQLVTHIPKTSFLSAIDFLVTSSRLGRVRFIGLLSFWLSTLGLLSFFPEEIPSTFILCLMLAFFIIVILNITLIKKRRLNDLNFSGWWLLLSLIPGVGFGIILYLCMKPGSKGDNKFGAAGKAATKLDYIFILMLPLLSIVVNSIDFIENLFK